MTTPLPIDQSVVPIQVSPGGTIILRGQWNVPSQDLVIDACQTGSSDGRVTSAHGLVDWAAGGWHLQARDFRTHSCTLVATGETGSACQAVGMTGPCLPSRLRTIAAEVPMTVADLRAGMSGGIEVDVPISAPVVVVASTPPAGSALRFVSVAALGTIAVAVLAACVRAWRVRRRRPEAQVRRVARRVRERLRNADPVFRSLAPRVADLVRRAAELARLRDRLRSQSRDRFRTDLASRRDDLARGTTPESAEALALVEARLARTDRLAREANHASDRLDRALEYLRSLDARLDDAMGRADGTDVRVAHDARLLRELERDVQSAIEGAREADRVTPTLATSTV